MIRRTRDERGSISIWLAVSSFVMMILVGLAVDLGGQVHAKQRAHDIAAEAARTGGEQVQAAPAIKGEYVAVDAVAGPQRRPGLPRRRRRHRHRDRSPAATPSRST